MKEIMSVGQPQFEIISDLLKEIYSNHAEKEIKEFMSQLIQILKGKIDKNFSNNKNIYHAWDSSSAILITYPDGVFRKGESTLKTLSELVDKEIGELSTVLHILPFLESTSDGGFAVSSHEQINSRFGDWEDLKKLSENHYLMADLVLNHVSSSHPWVQQFIQCESPGESYILSPQDINGWNKVIRPRSSALFTPLITDKGLKNVWTTFGPDQIDLDWHNPFVLLEFIKLVDRYISNGVCWIRLDAIAFIWKELNTSCLHRDQVHKLVKVIRVLLLILNSDGVLITETNVPEEENLSYLRTGDEAHLAYNFPLPPLLLEALFTDKADLVNKWLSDWPSLPENTTFLNFTASHDGIGLRALEGLMSQQRFHELLVNCEKRGGLISHRKIENGEDCPYELNISWWSAMADAGLDPRNLQIQRFLLSQLFTMSLKGIPAFYLQSLLASENDLTSFGMSGQRRDLNREKFEANTLFTKLNDKNSLESRILKTLKSAMKVRSELVEFHPESPMSCLTKNRSDFVILSRGENSNKVWAIHNMTRMRLTLCLSENLMTKHSLQKNKWKDCLNNQIVTGNYLELSPYNVRWMKRVIDV
tara:strand:+ start:952 stop:2721 length:1770 start_codon:yes stop_codon:yes gene_type:complete